MRIHRPGWLRQTNAQPPVSVNDAPAAAAGIRGLEQCGSGRVYKSGGEMLLRSINHKELISSKHSPLHYYLSFPFTLRYHENVCPHDDPEASNGPQPFPDFPASWLGPEAGNRG